MISNVTSRTGDDPRGYQRQRYRSLDQAWVNWCEQRILARLLTQCQLANGTVLDVPCGYGRFASLYARLGIKAVGADISPAMVHLAAQNHAQHSRWGWLCANILELPFADSAFDSVLCIRLLHHRRSDAERQRILGELARVSRRFIIISFYQSTPLHALARRWRGTRGRLAMTTFPRLRELAQASGLRILRVYSVLRFWHAQTFVLLTKSPTVGSRL
jgi:ubiquinone/menaquinone biosynthesis C-methylase UbiE